MVRYKKFNLILIAVVVVLAGNSYAAEQWRQYRHDWYRTGATTEELRNPSTSGDYNSFNLVWQHEFEEFPHANADIIMVNNIIYYSLMDGTIRAIDATANTYTELWVVNTGASLNNAPCVYDGRTYVVNLRGHVMSLNAMNGKTIWEYTVPTSVFSSPLYVNGRIYLGGINGVVYCFDAENGGKGPLWTFKSPLGMVDTALVYHKGKIMFSSENMHAYALNWRTGAVAWDVPISGDKTWNGSPVVAPDADKVIFRTLSPNDQWSSCVFRQVCFLCAGKGAPGYGEGGDNHPDYQVLNENDTYFNNTGREWTNTNVVLNTETGSEITNFNYGGQAISQLPFNSMYWNSIPWGVIDHKILIAEDFHREWKVDMTNNTILPSLNSNAPGEWNYFVRGDENVLSIISGRCLIGGLNNSLASINIDTNHWNQLRGDRWGDQAFFSHIQNRTFSTPHFNTFSGDGGSGQSGPIFPYRNRIYYMDNGWLFCMTPKYGSVTDINKDTIAPSVPTGLTALDQGSGTVLLSWNASSDNLKVTSYRVYRDNVQIATCVDTQYVDHSLPSDIQVKYQVTALDWPENESSLSPSISITPTGGDCTPESNQAMCARLGKNCGALSANDLCGNSQTINCGSCILPNSCGGGGVSNVCGCTPFSDCAAAGAECGIVSDQCGNTLTCDICHNQGESCGGGGPNKCGTNPCTPTTCIAADAQCGKISDGCSSVLDCGSCTEPELCNGAGIANHCGIPSDQCRPITCDQITSGNCGNVSDGCGGTIVCRCQGNTLRGGCGCSFHNNSTQEVLPIASLLFALIIWCRRKKYR